MQTIKLKPKAFLFDLNGTMIDDMGFHATAWHSIMTKDLGASISFDDVKKEMYGKNEEVLARVFGKNYFDADQLAKLSIDKEKRYQEAYLPSLALINGLEHFLERGKNAKIKMAIGSAAIPFNIDFVLDGLHIRPYFKAIVSANDVKISKPHAETFLKAAQILNISPSDCLVFEDVPKGVESAQNAGMKCIVVTTTHTADEFKDFNNILGFISDYNDPLLNQLF